MTLGETLRKARIEHCMSQTDLAKEFHISAQALSYFENNKKSPGMKTLKKYCDYFGLDPKELARMKYGEEENQDRNQ